MPEQRLSETELYIMRFFWQHGPMGTDALGKLVADKGWKPTTLLTFLSRLCAKGMLAVRRQGKSNLYSPLVSQSAYAREEGQAVLDTLYGGKARNFLSAMVEANALGDDDLADIRRWLDEQYGEG